MGISDADGAGNLEYFPFVYASKRPISQMPENPEDIGRTVILEIVRVKISAISAKDALFAEQERLFRKYDSGDETAKTGGNFREYRHADSRFSGDVACCALIPPVRRQPWRGRAGTKEWAIF